MRKGFIVFEQNVVVRFQPFDQVVFQQERFGFGRRFDDFYLFDLGDHPLDAHALPFGAGIRIQSFAQVFRFADIQHFALTGQHTVYAGAIRKKRQTRSDISRSSKVFFGFARRSDVQICAVFIHPVESVGFFRFLSRVWHLSPNLWITMWTRCWHNRFI